MSSQKTTKLLVLEGNIGAGKSTFLRLLQKHLNITIIPEPADKWQHIGQGENLLDLFYKDTKRWAYTFQSYAFISRINMILSHIPKHPDRFYALERSVYCDRYCFAQNCYESGFMSHLEWQIYKEWFSWLVESYTPKPHGFIYLRVAPETCIQRIQIRNRFEESNLSIDYLNSLHKKHDDWLMHKKDISLELSKIPILVLNCNKDFEHDTKELEKHLDNAKKFISSLEIKTKEKEISL